jgi:metallophosphoesterase (TIGR00282 family)
MKVLFVGDVFGRPGRAALRKFLPEIRSKQSPDFIIANVENAAGGRGLTPAVAEEIFKMGVDVLTLGNHTWDQKEVDAILPDPRILRPANYPKILPGHGWGVYDKKVRIGVLQLMGRHEMADIDCPFQEADRALLEISKQTRVIIVDMHAEATSEKESMGYYLDGRVSAVLGSHTHVQTADEQIFSGGTAYISDTGMTGPCDSVIGMEKSAAIKRFLTGLHQKLEVAPGRAAVAACLVDVDEHNGRSRSIERLYRRYEESELNEIVETAR